MVRRGIFEIKMEILKVIHNKEMCITKLMTVCNLDYTKCRRYVAELNDSGLLEIKKSARGYKREQIKVLSTENGDIAVRKYEELCNILKMVN